VLKGFIICTSHAVYIGRLNEDRWNGRNMKYAWENFVQYLRFEVFAAVRIMLIDVLLGYGAV
jgi:hypothetical protein